MKKAFLIFLLISLKLYSQDFEGKIEYNISYKLTSSKENVAALKKDLGTKTTFIVKKGFYKETTDSKYGNYHFFNPKEHKLYFTDKFSPDTLYFVDVKKKPNTKTNYKIVKNAGTILGHRCDKLIYKTDRYDIVSFYAADLKINPEYFKDFRYLNKNKIAQLMKCIFLKQTITTKDFIATMEASKITFSKIPEAEFTKPKYKILKEQ